MRSKSIEAYLHGRADELVELVSKLNESRQYESAVKVQTVLIAISKLADLEGFDMAAWPPVVEHEPDGYRSLAWAPDDEDDKS
jgi:hypothetical protein